MKLSQWAKQNSYSYRWAHILFKTGKIPNAEQLPTGQIIVKDTVAIATGKVATYARVSSPEKKDQLETQSERLISYCYAKGWKIDRVIKEIGSGLNDKRKKLESLLEDKSVTTIVVEHKDRLARFGTNYLIQLLRSQGRSVEIINQQENDRDDLMQDFVSIITSFTARLYGLRRSKRKTESLIEKLNEQDK